MTDTTPTEPEPHHDDVNEEEGVPHDEGMGPADSDEELNDPDNQAAAKAIRDSTLTEEERADSEGGEGD